MKEKLRKPLTALMMAWGTYLAIPCPYKVWDDALRPWQIVCLPPVGLVVGGIWALCAGIFAGLCGVLVHCFFENIFEEPYMMVYFWAIAAMIVYFGFLRKPQEVLT